MATRNIPLFPLHTVLFPRTPLTLRIFEERYHLMVDRCQEQERPFGVVLIREGHEAGAPATPHGIGTVAQLRDIKPISDGQLLIDVEGMQRFRLLDYAKEAEPYLVGSVEDVHDSPYDPAVVIPLAIEVRGLFHVYFERLVRMAGQEVPAYVLPTDAEDLSYVIAAVMQQAPLLARQRMLELTDTRQRLESEKDLLEKEIDRIAQIAPGLPSDVIPLTAAALQNITGRN